MTDQEKCFIATCKKLVANGGVCAEVDCNDCPFSCTNNRKGVTCGEGGFSTIGLTGQGKDPKVVESVKKYLEEHMEEIIGWPGNAEEMRQYIGREVLADNVFSRDWGQRATLIGIEIGNNGDFVFTVKLGQGDNIQSYRYIKVLPEPTTKEYTMDEVLKMAGLDPDKVRVKV